MTIPVERYRVNGELRVKGPDDPPSIWLARLHIFIDGSASGHGRTTYSKSGPICHTEELRYVC